jgi:hypothetical protein
MNPQTNSNFQQLLTEIKLLGEEATNNPTDESLYKQFQ